MGKDTTIDYEAWVDEALRGVLRRAIERVIAHGLEGDHHYYITFRTDAPGASVPDRLRAQYPTEMTIVLQHQFDGLAVAPEAFEVTLRFGGVPSRLRVPFAAVTAFADPGANFGLQYRGATAPAAPTPAESPKISLPAETQALSKPAALPAKPAAERADQGADDAGAPPAQPGDGNVIAIDSFRKR